MTSTINTITTPLAFNITVNCYLVRTDKGYILIDTGMSNQRSAIEQELEQAGCKPGTLKLIILTHGDSDHCGNAAFALRVQHFAQAWEPVQRKCFTACISSNLLSIELTAYSL